jgi:hypothetical protein
MDNPETQATLGSQDTGRRQRKQKAQHRKLTKGEQHVPTKNPVTKGEQHVPTKNPVTKDEQHVATKNPVTKDEQHVPTKNPVTKGEQHVPTKNPVTKGEQHVPTKNPVTKGEQHVPIKNPGVCDKVCQCLATGRLYSSVTQVFCHQLKQSPCYCSDNTTCI